MVEIIPKAKVKKLHHVWADFKTFISKGSVLDMAVGVIMASAFGAIVNAFTKILLNLATAFVPGGLVSWVAVLVARTPTSTALSQYSSDEWMALDATTRTAYASLYTNYGGTYYYSGSVLIDFGSLITAFVDFLVIALVLFLALRIASNMHQKRLELKIKEQEAYYTRHPEERPAPVASGAPAPTELSLLTEIRDQLKAQNPGPKK